LCGIDRPLLLPGAHALDEGLLDLLPRPDEDDAVVAVDDDGVAGLDVAESIVDATDDRDVEGTGDDGDMSGRRALLEDHRLQVLAAVVEQLRGPHGAGDENRAFR